MSLPPPRLSSVPRGRLPRPEPRTDQPDPSRSEDAADPGWGVLPALAALRRYSGQSFRRDLTAGLTVATVAVPQAMAYALIAGLPPQYGLYTAVVTTAIGALFSSSRQVVHGPTNAIAVMLLYALAPLSPSERVSTAILLCFLVGLIQVGISFLRLGTLIRHIPHTVILGFMTGAGCLLLLGQLRHLFGLTGQGPSTSLFHHDLFPWRANPWALSVGAGTIVLSLLLGRLNRRSRLHIPEYLTAVVVMAGCVWFFRLEGRGVRVVQDVPGGLLVFSPPPLEWARLQPLAGAALAIALLGLFEAIIMASVLAVRTGQELDLNQQCLSEGLANLGGSFFQCFPGSGSFTRSTLNLEAGAATQWAAFWSAVAVGLAVLLCAPLVRYIPGPALAGVLILSVWRLIDFRQLWQHLSRSRADAVVVLATAGAGLLGSLEVSMALGLGLALLFRGLAALRDRWAPAALPIPSSRPYPRLRKRDSHCGTTA
jgi:SulP family sulfate permease